MDGANAGALRILVVDDVADLLESMSMLLQLEGHKVATAKNAPGAILRAASFQPDVVLLDIGLPEISGFAAARRLREEMGATPLLIAMSGWTREEDKAQAREAGFDHYLPKPINLEKLKELLRLRRQPSSEN